ncbi:MULTISPECIES: mycothiol-dependent nitroreductase Rv2466c family protein [Actinokineospora]|uniref:DSBA-like thioredoxin domain-containing protein n=1 Tax=Actinokineospora fastidiosa TaxID=1816 RepID=A0A918GK41_9PSEU|nr:MULTISPECIES: DsbA family protein [Actinokineospora]UVS77645.1 DSBA-like thioredoxin domain protein [Actinokineospora sp. UTMC 2448]GGS41990.1 hypothetical protein GCM10010171_40940 [Actinokineospora fastidiosa]
MSVTIWFDPSCPYTWRTSRWLRAAAGRRDEKVVWRFLSLAVLNEGNDDVPERYRLSHQRALAALRVLAAVDGRHGQDAVDRLYSAIGERVHGPADRYLDRDVLVESLAEAGLPAELIDAADDASLDAVVRESHDAGQQRVGTPSGSPVVAFDDHPAFFGPVLSSVPADADADQAFEGLRLLSGVREFSEVKRARDPLS